jgi:hypothetical protein
LDGEALKTLLDSIFRWTKPSPQRRRRRAARSCRCWSGSCFSPLKTLYPATV